MTDFTNLAALVAQGQSLLDLVRGGHITQLEADNAAKLGEVDVALAAKIAQANTDIANATAPINSKLPAIRLSTNQELSISSGSVPDGMLLNASANVVVTTFADIFAAPIMRDGAQLSVLTEMQNDIKEQFADFDIRAGSNYWEGFKVIQLDWDFGAEFNTNDWVFHMDSIQGGNNRYSDREKTIAAFVKVLSGDVSGHFSQGVELSKWRFCSEQILSERFASYTNVVFRTLASAGSILLALPVISTGNIDHPKNIFSTLIL